MNKSELTRLRERRRCGTMTTRDGFPVMRRVRTDEVPVGFEICGACTGSGAIYNVYKHRHAYCGECRGAGLKASLAPDLYCGKA